MIFRKPKSLIFFLIFSICILATFFALPSFASADSVSQILTPTGYKNISDLKVGDQISAHDFDSGKDVVNSVERIDLVSDATYHYQDPYNFYLINGTYKLWKNQSVWDNHNVRHAFEVNVGDTIYTDSVQPITVASIQKIKDPNQWYEFIISGNHSYIQDGLQLHNASRYWVGGGSSVNWNATSNTNWGSASNTQDNASVPTSSDDVFFDGVGTGASDSTLSAAITIRSLNMTGYTNTLTHNVLTLSIGDGTAGASNNALIFGSLTYTLVSSVTSQIAFISTSATQQNVNYNGKTAGNVNFNGTGGSWKLTGTLANNTVSLTKGSLDTNGQTLNLGSMDSTNTNTRTLTLGSSSITLSVGSGNAWNTGTTTNLTFNANSSIITLSGATTTFIGGGLTYNEVDLTGSGTATVTGANTFTNFNRTGTAVKTDALSLSANQTVSSSLTLSGNSTTNRLLVKTDTLGTARTITANGITNLIQNADFIDITGAGSYGWNISAATGNSGDCGGNSGITFTTAVTNYWVASLAGTSTGNWSDSTHWGSTSGGIGGRVPLPQDDAAFDANSIDAASRNITADMPRLAKNINWTGATNTPTFTISSVRYIFGSTTLISGMSFSASGTMVFEGRSSFTLTSVGKSFPNIIIDMIGGTLTLQDNLTIGGSSNSLDVEYGTFDANGKDISFPYFNSSHSSVRTVTMGSGTWTLSSTGTVWDTSTTTSLTLNQNTSTIKITNTSNTANTFSGGGKTFNNIWFSRGASTANDEILGSNTFADFKDDGSAAHSLLFAAGTTQTVTTFTVSGTAGNLITINSSDGSGSASTSTHALVKAGGGTIDRDYLSIQHSVATPSSTWYAGTHSTNNQATSTAGSGWTFTAAPAVISIAGTVYTDEGTTTMGSGRTVSVSVNGAAAAGNTTTASNGTYTISSITVTAGDVLTLYLDGATEKAVTVTVTAGSNMTSINLYQNDLITRQDNSGSLTNTNLDTADNNADSDISAIYSVSGGALTVAAGKSLYIPTSNTYAPGGNVSVGGNFTNAGTYTKGTETLTLTGTSTQTVTTNSSSLYALTINGSGGTYTLQDALTTTNTLTITAGTLDTKSGSNYAISVGGNWSSAGNFSARLGTVTLTGTGSQTITLSPDHFYNLTINASGGTYTLQNTLYTDNNLTITAGTLDVKSGSNYNVDVTGNYFNSGTFTARSGTVIFLGSGSQTITSGSSSFYNINLNAGAGTYTLQDALTISNNLLISSGTLDVKSGSNYAISVGNDWTNAGGTFTARSGTVTITRTSASGTGDLTSGGSSFYNLTENGSGVGYALSDNLTATNTLTLTQGTLNANNKNVTVANFSSSNSNTRTITMGSGTWTLNGTGTVWTTATTTGLTLNQNTSTITISDTSSTSKTFAGGGKTYNILTITGSGTGAVIFTGANTFGNFTVNAPKTITFPASTTTTFSGTFTCSGSSGNVITLNSSSGGTQHTLSKASGTVDCDYMSIQDSNATGGATWNAGVNSTNVSDNSGWIFGTPTYNQEHFRFYSDNTVPAGLNTANPLAAQDTNYNVGVSTTFRLRIETANTGTGAGSITRRLEFKEDSGSWTQITTNSNNVRLSDSSNFTDGAATTTRLTAVGTFQAGQGKDTSSDTSSLSLTNGNYTEDEYSLILQSTASGHSYSFRITNSGTALDTYSVTPAINTPDATPPVPSGFNPATTSTIKTATPNITFNLDEAGDCKASTTNASYAAMSGADCTGDGSTAGSCTMPSLGSNGSKTIYFACQDVWGNQDTSGTTHSVTYTLNLSSGTTNPTLTIKGLGKVKGSGVAK